MTLLNLDRYLRKLTSISKTPSGLADYGRTALRQTEGTILNDCIDYEGYAEQVLEQKGFRCALGGEAYIKRNAQTFVSDYAQPSPEMTM